MERNKTRRPHSHSSRVSKKGISAHKVQQFQKKVLVFYRKHKRDLPWRHTRDPYHILVSEVMLQQTQVHRVIPKYCAFLAQYPTVRALARVSAQEVLSHWSGLGYNSRGLRLKKTAEIIVAKYGGTVPRQKVDLMALPGIGPYTAGAIRVFAFNESDVFLETNIRTVLIHEFFSHTKRKINESEMLRLIELVLPRRDFRGWYSALMDYGAHLKKDGKSHNVKAKQYAKQSAFLGSNREVRGAIVKILIQKKKLTGKEIQLTNRFTQKRLLQGFASLEKDRTIVRKGTYFILQD